jgi:hypothetical protein
MMTAAALAVLLPSAAAAELRLMMVEQIGCHWCAQWHAEIGPIYPKTDEGKTAPLFTHNIRDKLPEGITVTSPPHFTPTFILLQDGTEIDRIAGYPGEGFFWGLLGVMLMKAQASAIGTAEK